MDAKNQADLTTEITETPRQIAGSRFNIV